MFFQSHKTWRRYGQVTNINSFKPCELEKWIWGQHCRNMT